ncbi:nuclear RNA export factor 2 [Dasypus novemcinctus]|uniref:nuclear RNA export factor 2 n=1 Tax=Dasypus novemcinctus TaxID=9361 RepID=UPI00265FDDA2|nr:nuclear RNA export factor 2 [Dasypus novemcinctus]
MEYNDRHTSFQRRARGYCIFRRRYRNWYNQGSSGIHPSSHQEQDGDMAMTGTYMGPQVQYTPYAKRSYPRSGQWHYQCYFHAKMDMWKETIPPERAVGEKKQDETPASWYKVTVPYGRKYNKTWLLDSIQSHCSVPFTPVDFHYMKNRAQFFIEDSRTASALKDVNYKICDEENRRISIFVNPSAIPRSVQNKLNPEQMEQLKLTMYKRYDVFQQALDLQSLRFDPDLMGHDIDMILNRRNCMAATLKIIEEDFPKLLSLNLRSNKLYQLDGLSDIIQKAPKVKILNLSKNELKSAWELGKMKGLKLEELWLKGNPLCNNFSNQSTYISFILELFPKLLRLDGQELATPITTGNESPKKLPTGQGSFFGSEALKSLVLQFLQHYYLIYDYGDRQGLLSAYHDEACFSLTTAFQPQGTAPSSLSEYFKVSRNMKELKDPDLQVQLLKHTKYDIIDSLSVLPKTQHDVASFVVDMCIQMETMLCFSVNGVFQEVEGKSQGCVRAFTQTFITIPGSNSSLCIVNEELFVRNTSSRETQSAFSNLMPRPSSNCMPTLSQEQQEMVQAFSTQSGMNLKLSKKYPHDNNWDYKRGAQIFALPKAKDTMPEETPME